MKFPFISKLTTGNSRSIKAKKNIVASLLIKGVSIVVSLILVPLTIGYVSAELYGVWLTVSSIMVWLNFFDVGFTLGLKNRLGEAIANNDYEKGKILVSTTYFVMCAIFIPLCIILEFLIPYIPWYSILNISLEYNNEVISTMHVLCMCFCMQMILNVLVSIIAAFQKVALSSSFYVLANIVSVLCIALMARFISPSLHSLAWAISFVPIIVLTIASIILFRGWLNKVSPSIKSIKCGVIKDVFSLGAKFFIIQIQVIVLYQTTNLLITNVSGPLDVSNYNIAYKYLSVISMTFAIIVAPLWPSFTDAYTKKDYTWMQGVYKKMTRLYFLIAAAIILMVICSPIVYNLWIGDKVEIPLSMTIIIGIYVLINAWDSLQVQLINGIGKIKLQTYITLVGLIIHIPMSLFLGHYWGAVGVVASMVIINIIYASVFTVQINKLLKNESYGIWNK